MFLLFDSMRDRCRKDREDSDTAYFYSLMFFGEMVVKTIVAGLAAALLDETERHRYRQLHRLVRADGIGEWASVLDEILIGPANQHLHEAARLEQRELIEKLKIGSWQHEAVAKLSECNRRFRATEASRAPDKLQGRQWFAEFSELRNKTRGHGAITPAQCSAISPLLEAGISAVTDNFSLFKRPWVALRRNLSGKYRVTCLSEASEAFDELRSRKDLTYPNGIYFAMPEHRHVALIASNDEATEFYFPNGAFNDKTFETISYTTGAVQKSESSPYLAPIDRLPGSETQGARGLDVVARVFANTPALPADLVPRVLLEKELTAELLLLRHEVVSLTGRGGIGKTSLALKVLEALTENDRYFAIIWFSSRDIDLLAEGPKLVQPQLLTLDDFASYFVELADPTKAKESKAKRREIFSKALSEGYGGATLFVFDNFETVQAPGEIFKWIETYIRQPNKILITTRSREFKGDFPVEVGGMEEAEARELINLMAKKLSITDLLTDGYCSDLYKESDGHPYVIKVLLGEVAKTRTLAKPSRIVASKDEILTALFERTFAALTPGAQRIFLMLSNWRSSVPEIAVEAVMLRNAEERIDTEAALDELKRFSLIEMKASANGEDYFITVPLSASIFGKRKLSVSPGKVSIEADTELLQFFGATQTAKHEGLAPRIKSLFRNVAQRASTAKDLEGYVPMLEFIAVKYPLAWHYLADLHEESEGDERESHERARSAMMRFLEGNTDPNESFRAWERVRNLSRSIYDYAGELHALVEMAKTAGVPLEVLSECVSDINHVLSSGKSRLDSETKSDVLHPVIRAFVKHVDVMSATQLSRLAWLYIQIGNVPEAVRLARIGLSRDPSNRHCLTISEKHL